jgi:hypothetical protein
MLQYNYPLSKKLKKQITLIARPGFRIVFDDDPSSLLDEIEIFQFRPLNEIEKELRDAEVYSESEIAGTLEGLSRLPGYANNTGSTTRGGKRS